MNDVQIDLVAFIPDGAILPRQSGVSDLPMDASKAAAFKSPESLEASITCPSGKKLTGMGIKCGITMITVSHKEIHAMFIDLTSCCGLGWWLSREYLTLILKDWQLKVSYRGNQPYFQQLRKGSTVIYQVTG